MSTSAEKYTTRFKLRVFRHVRSHCMHTCPPVTKVVEYVWWMHLDLKLNSTLKNSSTAVCSKAGYKKHTAPHRTLLVVRTKHQLALKSFDLLPDHRSLHLRVYPVLVCWEVAARRHWPCRWPYPSRLFQTQDGRKRLILRED